MKIANVVPLLLLLVVSVASANELTGNASVEGAYFFNGPQYDSQEHHRASIALEPEYYHGFESGLSFTFTPFIRIDSADSERTHFDIRELNFLYPAEKWEIKVGVSKEFWGTTEFAHLVDIINQTDLVEYLDGEDKLGQPMVKFSIPGETWSIDTFLLPYFRERTFPGKDGRLRSALPVDTDQTGYESNDKENHVDFAVRALKTIEMFDVGVSYFQGTSREPNFSPGLNSAGEIVLIPFYPQIRQVSLDLQGAVGAWLVKFESIYRHGEPMSYMAVTGGFEYTFTQVADTQADVGIIGEWVYDERGDDATTPYQNDAILGVRLAVNDQASTEILAGLSQDLESSARVFSIEASARLTENIKGKIEAYFFMDFPEDDLLYSLRRDDFVRLELIYYY